MAYLLQSLLNIREMREDRAGKALVAARHSRDLAKTELENRRVKLARYEGEKESRRDKVFAAIIGRAVSRQDIDLAREAVARIDEEGALLKDGVVRAEGELEAKEVEADKANKLFVVATRSHQKIVQHRAIWEAEEKKLAEQAADREMEEFTGRKMTDDDSDDFD